MSQTKHTAGPWKRETPGSVWIVGPEIDGERGRLLAQECGPSGMSAVEHDANADLIAAAKATMTLIAERLIEIERRLCQAVGVESIFEQGGAS